MSNLEIWASDPSAIFRRVFRARGLCDAMRVARLALDLIREDEREAAYLLYIQLESDAIALDKLNRIASPEGIGTTFNQLLLDDLNALEDVQPRPALINGVLRQAEVGLMVGAAKANKTWLGIDLAHSISEGGRWMGCLPCAKGNVLYVDAESSREMIAERMRLTRIDRARSESKISILPMRGKLPQNTHHALEIICQGIAQSDCQLCIIDTLTAYFPIENENDNAEATRLMSQIVLVAEQMQCAILMIHHTPKMTGLQRTVVDAGAGAGAYSRRADSIVTIRQDEGENFVDIRARSFAELSRFVVTYGATMTPQGENDFRTPLPAELKKKTVKTLGIPV